MKEVNGTTVNSDIDTENFRKLIKSGFDRINELEKENNEIKKLIDAEWGVLYDYN